MEDMIRQYVATILRNLAAPLIVWLASTGYISNSEATNLIVAAIAVVLSLAWGLGNKYVWGRKVETALELPANSSPERLKDVIANK